MNRKNILPLAKFSLIQERQKTQIEFGQRNCSINDSKEILCQNNEELVTVKIQGRTLKVGE